MGAPAPEMSVTKPVTEAPRLGRAEALAVLAFHVKAGASDAVGETAIDRFALGDTPPPRLARPAAAGRTAAAPGRADGAGRAPSAGSRPSADAGHPRPPATAQPAVPAGHVGAPTGGFDLDGTGAIDAGGAAAIAAARERAASAASLADLRALLEAFDDCPLKLTAQNLVFADGNPEADLMLVGEAPGREEDAKGLPFVGRSGQLLDKMLAAIGRDRTSAYITNVIPWRPPGNRTPGTVEVETCRPFAVRHIELVRPKVLVCLGGASAKLLLGATDGIKRLRGRWVDYDAGGVPIAATATLHPAYLLRTPIDKRLAWRDLLAIKQRLDTATGAG